MDNPFTKGKIKSIIQSTTSYELDSLWGSKFEGNLIAVHFSSIDNLTLTNGRDLSLLRSAKLSRQWDMDDVEKRILEGLITKVHRGHMSTINATQCTLSLFDFDIALTNIDRLDGDEKEKKMVLFGEEMAKALLQVTCKNCGNISKTTWKSRRKITFHGDKSSPYNFRK